MLQGDFLFLGDVDDALDDVGMIAGAVGDGGAVAENDIAVFAMVDAGGIGGVGDVEADGDVGLEAVGGHFGAETTDFFLNGVENEDVGGRLFAGGADGFEGLGDDVAAYAVVEGAPDKAVFAEGLGGVCVDGGVADAEAKFGDFFGIGSTDVDVKLVNLGSFFVVFVVADVDGGVADDAENGAVVSEDLKAPTTSGGGVGAADAVEVEEAFFGDVFDHVANLIGMSFEHDRGCLAVFGLLAFNHGPGSAVGVVPDSVRVFASFRDPDFLAAGFKPSGAGGVEEFFEESVHEGMMDE